MDTRDEELKRLEAAGEAGAKKKFFDAELSGTLSAGYRGKHLPEDHESKLGARERKAERLKDRLSRLQALLADDPAYAALYEETFDRLRDAETVTEAALTAAQTVLADAQQELDDTLDNANTLQDGTKVFRDPGSGSVYDETGRLVEGDELDAVVWREDAPTWQDFKAKRQAVNDAQDRIDALRHYQTDVLGYARERLTDEDNPPDADELRRIQDDIEQEFPALAATQPERQGEAPGPSIGDVKLPPPAG